MSANNLITEFSKNKFMGKTSVYHNYYNSPTNKFTENCYAFRNMKSIINMNAAEKNIRRRWTGNKELVNVGLNLEDKL